MIFIPLLLLGVIFYFTDKRVLSVLIFFFFITNGFQLVPMSLFDTKSIITKPLDFAVLYTFIISAIGVIKYRDFIIKNRLSAWVFIFLCCILIIIYISKYELGIGWSDIIRTSRNFSLLLVFFVFRRLTSDEIKTTIRILLYITSFLCTLYVIQAFIGIPLLSGDTKTGHLGKITRYYNVPILYYFTLFIIVFKNPFKGFWKYASIFIFILVCIVSLHRSLMIAIFLSVFTGIFLQGGFKGVVKYIFIGGLILIPFMEKLTERFEDTTSNDIQSVMEGAFDDYGEVVSVDGTFLFRIAHFYERYDYVIEKPMRAAFGVGLMTEDSPITRKTFEFKIGVPNEDHEVTQLDTSDIAWSNFILRLGFIGTILYLCLYFVVGQTLYKHRKNKLALASFLYILLLFLISFTSSLFYNTESLTPALLVIALILRHQEEKNESDFTYYDNTITQSNNTDLSI